LYAPVRGFGKVWFANADVRQRLGWATAPESSVSAAIQEFEHGTMMRFDPANVRILYQSHVWEQFAAP